MSSFAEHVWRCIDVKPCSGISVGGCSFKVKSSMKRTLIDTSWLRTASPQTPDDNGIQIYPDCKRYCIHTGVFSRWDKCTSPSKLPDQVIFKRDHSVVLPRHGLARSLFNRTTRPIISHWVIFDMCCYCKECVKSGFLRCATLMMIKLL